MADDDLEHLSSAIEAVKEEKDSIRALVQRGDFKTNRWVVRLGYFAALLAVVASLAPLIWIEMVVVALGVLGGTVAGSAVYLQSRWNTRRALLEADASKCEDLLLSFTKTSAEIEGARNVLSLPERASSPTRPRRRKRKKKKP